jgi:hypothetical protein
MTVRLGKLFPAGAEPNKKCICRFFLLVLPASLSRQGMWSALPPKEPFFIGPRGGADTE